MSASPAHGATVLERGPTVIDGRLPDETVLLRTDSGDSVRLNATAAWLWDQLESKLTLEQLSERLRAEFDLDREQAAADAAGFAEALSVRGFLSIDLPAG